MLKPLGHRLLVEPENLEEKTGTGIIIKWDDREKKAVQIGKILAIGETAWKEFGGDAWAEVGDRVYFARYSGAWLTDPEDNKEYLLLNDEDIIAKVNKND